MIIVVAMGHREREMGATINLDKGSADCQVDCKVIFTLARSLEEGTPFSRANAHSIRDEVAEMPIAEKPSANMSTLVCIMVSMSIW